MSVLFTEAFDVWYDNSSYFYKLPMDWFVFLLFPVGVFLVKRTIMGSGCLVGLCESDPYSFARNSGVEHTCLALWMRVWITDSLAEMGWLEL